MLPEFSLRLLIVPKRARFGRFTAKNTSRSGPIPQPTFSTADLAEEPQFAPKAKDQNVPAASLNGSEINQNVAAFDLNGVKMSPAHDKTLENKLFLGSF